MSGKSIITPILFTTYFTIVYQLFTKIVKEFNPCYLFVFLLQTLFNLVQMYSYHIERSRHVTRILECATIDVFV